MNKMPLNLLAVLFLWLSGCEKKQDKPAPPAQPSHAPIASKPVEKPAAPAPAAPKAEPATAHTGEVLDLGSLAVDDYSVHAFREKTDLEPGGEATVDIEIDGGLGDGITAVRIWIGTEDGAGSMKARADVENGKWHTHVEIPSPAPTGCRLWVEIDGPENKKLLGSFDLHK